MKASTFQAFILGLLCLVVAGVAGTLYNQHQRIVELQTTTAKPEQHLESLQQDSSRLLDAQEALRQELDALRLAVDNSAQANTLDSQQDQWTQEIQALRNELAARATGTELAALQARIEQAEQQLQALQAKPRRATARPPAKPRKPLRPPVPAPLPPPFTVLGTESRGGERFLLAAPLGSRSLAEVRLLHHGERIGTWHLKTLGASTAIFAVPEQPDQTIPLP
ncbi:chemotaxis protein [Pseudomonas sp. GD03721]|nr:MULTISPECIES: chemotaxis protein [unclassified Pseudomonas]MDH1440372.1 chemotaxis protein [Pseudomonas sp. GD03722]WGG03539.1 chemotaxis protein [Pseudomonas sp. GD03721]WGG07707.1 chemotaxis protein [Pseudomonas sp. GD03919]